MQERGNAMVKRLFCVLALMLALSIRLYYRYNTLNLDEIIALSGKEEV